jgi:exodeoxyribonuclease V beta subunit
VTPLDPSRVTLSHTTLIEASAGTGKTHTITTLYVRLLLERGLQPSEILVVTYTNAATAELRARIRRRVRDALVASEASGAAGDTTLDAQRRTLTAALCAFDEAAIFTIHGFCQRMLQEHAFESGVPFDTQLVTDQVPLRDEVVRDFWAREVYGAPEPFVRYLQQQRITPAALLRLAQTAVAHPSMPVFPEHLAAADTGLDTWREAHARVVSLWHAERDGVVRLLASSDALKGNRYSPEAIRKSWAPQMDVELAAATPGIVTRFDKFEKFTTSALREATKKGRTSPAHPFFDACDALHEADAAVENAFANRLLRLQLDLVRYARREIPQRNQRANTQSFDDLLHRLDAALAGPGGGVLAARIRNRFRAALIDEFQDTDPVQYDIFRRVYRGRDEALFLIGDPKQAIYSFRGADVFTYIDARRDAGKTAYTLATNWRSGPRLVTAVNTLFTQARDPFVFDGIPFRAVDPAPEARDALAGTAVGHAPLQILLARPPDGKQIINKGPGAVAVTQAVAAEIVRLISSDATIVTSEKVRAVEPSDIAVLCRTNAQASDMQEALRALRVPSVLHGDASVFDAPEATELERVLRALADPRDAGAVRAALATTLMGLSGDDLLDLQSNEPAWDTWLRRFQEWHDAWRQRGFVPAFRHVLDEHGVQRRLLALTDGERRMTNLLHLGELLQTALTEAQRGPQALLEWLDLMRHDPTARADLGAEAAQIRLESDDRAVQLVTIHKSKGLEYGIVFCPYLWDGMLLHGEDKQQVRFHDRQNDNRLTLDIGSTEHAAHIEWAEEEALAENLRLLYVALTRAKHRCTVVWGPFNEVETSALGYLLHQSRAVAPGANRARAAAERIKGLDVDGMRADLDRLVSAADGTIAVGDLSYAPSAPYTKPGQREEILQCRTTDRVLHPGWRTSSFSALTAYAGVSRAAEEGLDHDETTEDDAVEAPTMRPTEQPPVVLHAFPAGVRSGLLLHEVLQHLDFQQVDDTLLRASLAETLRRNGFEADWADALCRAVTDIIDAPLDGQLRLRAIAARQRLNELEFIFPVAGETATGMLTGARLADVFRRHGTAPLPPDYPERVRQLGFGPLAGYLRGFIDLAFEHAGRWFVVDYKSNLLGPHADDYGPPRLAAAMAQHHYFLQYHLYAVALHRYLTLRRSDYDYDQHFGGVLYLFLRGMSPQHPPGCGVFRDRPARALIEGLSAALAHPGGEGNR